MKSLTLENITRVCGGVYHGSSSLLEKEISSVTTDSRKVEADSLFVPIVGERVDAHKFIPQVMEAGALATLSEKVLEDAPYPYILVESSLQAVKDIAEFYLEELSIPVVGITGSVGKTSTKEFIAAVLSEKYNVLKTEGNFNNEIGLPLTILKIRDEHEIAVIEMGISHFGDMKPLGEIAKPDICVITNIGYCHLEHLIDRDGVLKEKTDMFNYAKDDAQYILNGDDDKLATVTEVRGKTPIFVSIDDGAKPVHIKGILKSGIEGSVCVASVHGEEVELSIPVPGKHMISNALVACAVGKICGVNTEQMKQGIAKIKPVGGRVNIIKSNKYTIIDDCYNANPVSMKASIDVLKYADTRKVAILGDMFELGADEAKLHKGIGEYVAKTGIDMLVTVGNISENIDIGAKEKEFNGTCMHYSTLEECLEDLENTLENNDTILVKASHGMHLEKIINLLTK